MILLILLGFFILIVIVLAILDSLNITHIFMKGRPSGAVGSGFRALQDALDPSAQKAHRYIIEQKEEKDKFQIPSSEEDNKKKQNSANN
jgi:hypothetical protein